MVNPVGIREAINKKQKVYFRILPLNLPIYLFVGRKKKTIWAYDRKKTNDNNDGCNDNDGHFDDNDAKKYHKTYKYYDF